MGYFRPDERNPETPHWFYIHGCNSTHFSPCFYNTNPETMKGDAYPPAIITIDYGDGSPVLQWSRENPINIFRHGYLRSGTYDMSLTGLLTFKH